MNTLFQFHTKISYQFILNEKNRMSQFSLVIVDRQCHLCYVSGIVRRQLQGKEFEEGGRRDGAWSAGSSGFLDASSKFGTLICDARMAKGSPKQAAAVST